MPLFPLAYETGRVHKRRSALDYPVGQVAPAGLHRFPGDRQAQQISQGDTKVVGCALLVAVSHGWLAPPTPLRKAAR